MMLDRFSRTKTLFPIATGCFLLVSGFAFAESPITNAHDVDAHFEIASKDFGDGVVQLHSRKGDSDNATHSVHSIDCTNKAYASVFTGNSDPELFPLDSLGFNLEPIGENSTVASLAQHACKKHGYPLLEW